MSKERWGYPLTVLEGFINAKAGHAEANFTILDRQLQLAHIERLEHIALALENLSDVGDVIASKLTFGAVPGAETYGEAPPSPGAGPATLFREKVATAMHMPAAAIPFCDAPGCKETAVHHAVVDGVGRRVCVIHTPMLKQGGNDAGQKK